MPFAEEIIDKTKFDVFLVEDKIKIESASFICDETWYDDSLLGIVAANESYMLKNGFYGCNINGEETHIKKKIIAYDKFLFFFTQLAELKKDYDFVWVFEDDVFIPNVQTIVTLNLKYGTPYDLAVANHNPKVDNLVDWHWEHIIPYIEGPWFSSMVCAAGFSREMLNEVEKYRHSISRYIHIESMFNTIADHSELCVIPVPELKSCVWMGDWGLDEFIMLPDNVFHPLKQIGDHQSYRDAIKVAKENGYNPNKHLPEFLKS